MTITPEKLEDFRQQEYLRNIEAFAFAIYLNSWLYKNGESVKTVPSEDIGNLHKKWVEEWIPSLQEPHCGDCTNMPAPCTRCHTDGYYIDATKLADFVWFENQRVIDREKETKKEKKHDCNDCVLAEQCGGQL